jgi:hypothetical protein
MSDMTDAQMIEKVARDVMGFQIMGNGLVGLMCRLDGEERISFNPFTDANDTQMIKDKLREMGWIIIIGLYRSSTTATLWREGLRELLTANADTEARAICEVAIKAVEGGEK